MEFNKVKPLDRLILIGEKEVYSFLGLILEDHKMIHKVKGSRSLCLEKERHQCQTFLILTVRMKKHPHYDAKAPLP